MAEKAVKPQSVVGPVGILQLKGGAGNTLMPTTKQAARAPQSFNLVCTSKTHSTQEIHLLMTLVLSFEKIFVSFFLYLCTHHRVSNHKNYVKKKEARLQFIQR